MINNIGTTIHVLTTDIGNSSVMLDPLNTGRISMITGQLGIGAILADRFGTIGVVTSCVPYTPDPTKLLYYVRTVTVNTDVLIEEMLLDEY